jgi:hypothetical protein
MEERRYIDAIRANVAGSQAVAVHVAAEQLFHAGGKELLAEGSRQAVRELAERSAKATLAVIAPQAFLAVPKAVATAAEAAGAAASTAGSTLGTAASTAGSVASAAASAAESVAGAAASAAETVTSAAQAITRAIGGEAAPLIAREVTKTAAKEVLKGVGRAAGIGFVIDGVFGGVKAALAYKNGEMTRKEAAIHTGKEAATGALATGAGVALVAGLVAVTGAVTAPLAFVVAAGAAIGTKHGLRRLIA